MSVNTRFPLARLKSASSRLALAEFFAWFSLTMGSTSTLWWIASAAGIHDLALFAAAIAMAALASVPMLSPVSDRYERPAVVKLGLLLCAVDAVGIALWAWLGHYSLWTVLALSAFAVCGQALWTPSSGNLMADLVAADRLPSVAALQKRAQYAGKLAGPAAAGVFLTAAGLPQAFTLSAAAMIAALFVALGIRNVAATSHASHRKSNWLNEARAGFLACWRIPTERGWITMQFLSFAFLVPCTTILIPMCVKMMGLEPAWLGTWEAALSLGMLFGTFASQFWCAWLGRFGARIACGVIEGLLLALAGMASNPVLIAACFAGAGYANSTLLLAGYTHRMLARPTHLRGRMAAASMTATQIAAMVGSAAGAAVVTSLSVSQTYVLFGTAAATIALCGLAIPGMKRLLSLNHDEATGYYERAYPGVLEGH